MKRFLLKLARLPFLGWLVGWCIAHLAHILPLRIAEENEQCIAFHHPLPSYETHLLIMQKTPARDIACICAEQFRRIIATADAAIDRLGLSAPHIMLWTNGGKFQEVRQLHFHLFPAGLDCEDGLCELRTFSIGETRIRECRRKHSDTADLLIMDAGANEFAAVFSRLMNEYSLETRGYSVFLDLAEQAGRRNRIYIRIG